MGKVCITSAVNTTTRHHSLYVWFESGEVVDEKEKRQSLEYCSFKETLVNAIKFKGYGVKASPHNDEGKIGMIKITGLPEMEYFGFSKGGSVSVRFWFCIPYREVFKVPTETAKLIFHPITSNVKPNTPYESWGCGFNG